MQEKTPGRAGSESEDSRLVVWLSYYQFIEIAANRVARSATVEDFENALDEIDWQSLDAEMLYKYSTLIGYVYLKENRADWRRKVQILARKGGDRVGTRYFADNSDLFAALSVENAQPFDAGFHRKKPGKF